MKTVELKPPGYSLRHTVRRSEELLAAAEQQAARVQQEAHARAASEFEAARADGFVQGRVDAIYALLAIDRLADNFTRELSGRLTRLIVEVCSKVIHGEVKTASESIQARIRDALQIVRPEEQVTLTVAPSDKPAVEAMIELLSRKPCPVELKLDAGLTPGTCALQSVHGSIKSDLSAHLDAIAQHLSAPEGALETYAMQFLDWSIRRGKTGSD